MLYLAAGSHRSSCESRLLDELSDRYELTVVDCGGDGCVAPGPPGKSRFADYLATGLFDRLERLPSLRRLLGGLYSRLRPLSLASLRHSPLALVGLLRRDAATRARRVSGTVARAIEEANAWLILAAPTLSSGASFGALRAAVRARVPVVFLPSGEDPSATRQDLVHSVEPAARRVRRRNLRAGIESISDLYGARAVAAEFCGIPERDVRIPGFWIHGWIPAYHNVHPALVAQHKRPHYGLAESWKRDPFDKQAIQLVERRDQELYLRANGYTRVKAIGHPSVYLKQPSNRRIPGSLLVMPPRGDGDRRAEDPLVRKYVDCIAELSKRFSTVRLCVSTDDYIKQSWWVAFEEAGIDHMVGPDGTNPRGHHQIAGMLRQFEYVTTNGYGSHIVYAALAGCRVSIYGPFADPPVRLMRKAHAVAHFPELLDLQVELCSERAVRKHYSGLFLDPDQATERVEWARHELGHDLRLAPTALRLLVTRGWEALASAGAARESVARPLGAAP